MDAPFMWNNAICGVSGFVICLGSTDIDILWLLQ